ncbi:Diguanylate cyclase with PAS/PAC sensor OS=Tsukamurella paurometabola (strain ATCC 8368 / DSM/ CCUG 35730 / CIP 100753 / JCM 10117 / KCTC 9821 / NBRC 16120/ NCIMB 702349 / NCTC 13040) OX=521096 GN=Tpau_3590 PE=4 SV=1 [Tsukamurella paurometabola]|uniref:Diguanylate cyclase with PAS/PAC sensor n=1 Tax=Tsukamurella paurometabola (strain ATCC 8368 / DSM 20162 / CCUG 35730 / CIP 100753 / JCM 10117 / KCTC 9821 / NBRC 16120 / NCIMB 702349 / NCTC 13040) TaxID=521096 RepID=D5UXT1_TSUPD|nr:sensor domain-containing diguanylate cyclase [Tsukamurella paurometabola]ADG80168.1 diguanylate cyclase with PAS/PAC sensor [Tsukamurella paurometabola DSM 20162]SUP38686.1 Probable diguanylate cyclase YdaM [Tsukamurella paurometabola]
MPESVPPLSGLVQRGHIAEHLADEFINAVIDHVYLPIAASEYRAALTEGFERILDAVEAEEFAVDAGRELGELLVALQVTKPLGATACARIVAAVPDVLSPEPSDRSRRRAAQLIAEFTGGYASALTDRIFEGQALVYGAADLARRSAEEGARQAQARTRIMFEHAGSPIFIADEEGRVLEASPMMTALMESNRALLGPDGDDVRRLLADDPREVARTLDELSELDDESATRFLEHGTLISDGDISVGRWALSRVRSHDGRPALIVGVGHDVTELRVMHAKLDHLAHHDPLTGIPNRRSLEAAVAQAVRTGPVGFCLVDLDDFKSINDRLGHAAGDQLLIAVTRRLQSALAGKGALYRVGGDEFAVLVLPPFHARDAVEVVQRTLARPLDVQASGPRGDYVTVPVRIGASVGVTASSPERTTVEVLIAAADPGLYRSKDARRS